MTLYAEFAEYATGFARDWVMYQNYDQGPTIASAPMYLSFRSPPIRNGDKFDLRAALLAVPELQMVLSGPSSGIFTNLVDLRRVDIDYEILHVADEVRGLSAYPGKPPRYNIGSITESLDSRIIHYSYLTYNPQYIGRRTLLLGEATDLGGWGAFQEPDDGDVPYRYFFLHRGTRAADTPISQVQIHVPQAIWDVNESIDPPEEPSFEPLDFVIQGNAAISYNYLYRRWEGDLDPPRYFYSTQVINSWDSLQLAGSMPDLLEPLADIDFSADL